MCNRGPETAPCRVLPTLWFRNTWAWGGDTPARPMLAADYTLEIPPGDTGAGIGASHQTGWTGLLATLLTVQADLSAADLLEGGIQASLDI